MTDRNICEGDTASFWDRQDSRDVFLSGTVLPDMLGGFFQVRLSSGQVTQRKRADIASVHRGSK